MAKVGRPKIEIDMDILGGLCRIHCTNAEIASILGINEDTFYDRVKNDKEFSEIIKKHRNEGKMSLRRIQWDLAKKGSTAMAIFLGKNLLNQTDSPQESEDNSDLEFI